MKLPNLADAVAVARSIDARYNDNLAAGETHESIIRGYHVEEEDIQAALRYAADLARDRVVALPAGAE